MTFRKFVAESLERVGAAGLAYASAETTADSDYVAITDIKPFPEMFANLGEEFMDDCIVVWASADGTLFPSAEERDAHDGGVITNEMHWGRQPRPAIFKEIL